MYLGIVIGPSNSSFRKNYINRTIIVLLRISRYPVLEVKSLKKEYLLKIRFYIFINKVIILNSDAFRLNY